MPLDLTAALVAFLVVIVWRLAHRPRPSKQERLRDVLDAPPLADPALAWRYSDDGFTRYLAEVPQQRSEGREED